MMYVYATAGCLIFSNNILLFYEVDYRLAFYSNVQQFMYVVHDLYFN